MEDQLADATGNLIKEASSKVRNQVLGTLLVFLGGMLLFLLSNIALYKYAQKTLPPKKKKPAPKRKMKKERRKRVVSAPAE